MSGDPHEDRPPESRNPSAGQSPARRIQGLSAVVLCGGRSLRFGGEKGLARFRGIPLVERVLARMDEVSADVWISTHRPDLYEHLGRPMVADVWPDCGPLGGIHAALSVARNPVLAVVSCDMPFASPDLFRFLCTRLGNLDGVIPFRSTSHAPPGLAGGRPSRGALCEPLHAVYARSCLLASEAALARGDRRVVSFFPQVRVAWVSEEEWLPLSPAGEDTFANINTVEDLARLERIALD
jgi:molybdopterin-guanine dinucleotide biosynthesis protein A